MTALQKDIETHFASKFTPNRDQLVEIDGYDLLEKESATEFFSGKTCKELLSYLQLRATSIVAGAAYRLEEWSVLKANARYYFIQAYLEFLLDTLDKNEPDEQFVSDFFHQLYQTVYMYGDEAYNKQQEDLLRKIAESTLVVVKSHSGFKHSKDWISDNVAMFISELEKYE